MSDSLKLYILIGLLAITILTFYILVYRLHYTATHSDANGQNSWNRHIGTFLILFAVVITEYQLVYSEPDAMLIGTILTIAIGGKVVNSGITENRNKYNGKPKDF